MWPLAVTTQMLYTGDRRIWEEDRQHFLDTARHIGARYWVRAPDDFLWCAHNDWYLDAEDGMLRGLPVVFESSGKRFRVYDLSSLQEPLAAFPVRSQSDAKQAAADSNHF